MKIIKQIYKWIARVLVALLIILVLILALVALILKVPAVQQYAADYAVEYVRNELDIPLTLERINIDFPDAINLEQIYLEDQQGDTLLYGQKIGVDIALFELLDNVVNIETFQADKLVAKVNRKANQSDFNYQFVLDQFSGSDTTTQSKNSAAWQINAESIQLNHIDVTYDDDSTNLLQRIAFIRLDADLQTLDLEKNRVEINRFLLEGLESYTQVVSDTVEEESADSVENISLQTGWDIQLAKLQLIKNRVVYNDLTYPDTAQNFDPNHLNLKNINLLINEFAWNDTLFSAELASLSMQDKSGLAIENFQTQIAVQDSGAAILHEFKLITPYSKALLDLDISYLSLNELLSFDKIASIDFDLQTVNTGYEDLAQFVPRESIKAYEELINGLNISGKLKGVPADKLSLEKLFLKVSEDTHLAVNGELQQVTNLEKLAFSLQLNTLQTTRADLQEFLPNMIPSQVSLPSNLEAKASIEGNLQNAQASFVVASNYGAIEGESIWQSEDTLKATLGGGLEFNDFELGSLLPNYEIGNTTASLDYTLLLPANSDMSLKAALEVDTIQYNSSNWEGLDFKVRYQEEALTLKGNSNNKDLDFELQLTSELKTVQKHDLDLQIKDADLIKLGISDSITSFRANINLVATLNSIDDLNATLKLNNAQFIRADQSTELSSLSMELFQQEDSLFFESESELIDAELYSNLNLSEIVPEITSYLSNYVDLGEVPSAVGTNENDYLSLTLNAKESAAWQDLIVPGLDHSSAITLAFLYREATKHLEVDLQTDSLSYSGIAVDTLDFYLLGDYDKFKMRFNSNKISNGSLALYQPNAGILVANDTADASIMVKDSVGRDNFIVSTQLSREDSSYYIHINSDTLLLSGEAWQVSTDNYVLLKKGDITVKNFTLKRSTEELSVKSINREQDALAINFENFKLGNFLEVVGLTKNEIDGEIDGKVTLSQLFSTLQFKADLTIDSLKLYEVSVGNMQVEADNSTPEKYNFAVDLNGNENDLQIQGDYVTGKSNRLDLTVDINAIDLEVLEGLSSGELTEASGFLKGELAVKGEPTNPVITGELAFVETSFFLSYLNTGFEINDQKVIFESKAVVFNDFILTDQDQNEAEIDGSIIRNTLLDYQFDLQLTARNFRALDTESDDNELYYGTVNINSDIQVTGNVLSPVIDMSIELLEGSEVTYIVPEDELLIEEQKGIVEFVQVNESDTLVLSNEADSLMEGKLTGLDINMKIDIRDDTKFIVIIDEDAGDRLEIEGEGDLVFGLQRNGNMTLTGRYNIADGFYLLTFYGIVKKRFDLADGSNVVWRGDPYNATLSIQAMYETRTSPQTLMANAGNDGSQYKKPEVFEVLMNIGGNLEKPQISFELDIPQSERNNASIYNTVKLLNQNEAELNKQVFALLVLNSFISTTNSEQEIGDDFISSTARSSVSQLLTQQLNNLSEKYIKGLQLDLNLDSYGSGSQAGTDLQVGISKSLLDDRITVEVGGSYQLEGEEQANNNNLIGNVAIEYKITEDGRYRLRFYQMNDNSILDGQVTSTGLSIIFTRDYDKLKNLFKKKEDEN